MTASVSPALTEAHQEVDQAVLSDFNDSKCWTWAIRNCGDFLSRSGLVNRGCCKKTGINWWLLPLTRSTKRSWAHGIWNNSWFANGRFSKFELPSFQNGFQFNCHFGLRLDFGLDTLHYPLQHRPRFWLGFFMRLQRTCVPATLVTSRAFKLFIRHLFSKKTSANNVFKKTF